SAEDFDAANLTLSRVVGIVEIESGGVDRISVDYDAGAGLIDAPEFEVEGDELVIRQLGRFTRTSCSSRGGRMTVSVNRSGRHPVEDFGRFVIRVPAGAEVSVEGGLVQASIGDTGALDVGVDGCGDVVAGNVAGDAGLAVNGPGDIMVGDIGGHLDAAVNGSGDIETGAVMEGVDAAINGSGDIEVAAAHGAIDAAIRGSGDIAFFGGEADSLDVAIMGSGDVTFDGVAGSVDLASFGSGDVNVASVTGNISRAALGSGSVNVGNN
ncbi:MAG: DUF2807 domain-containing protein, partial [Maricaulaceae bacterium]